jgi:hypothetical protein
VPSITYPGSQPRRIERVLSNSNGRWTHLFYGHRAVPMPLFKGACDGREGVAENSSIKEYKLFVGGEWALRGKTGSSSTSIGPTTVRSMRALRPAVDPKQSAPSRLR